MPWRRSRSAESFDEDFGLEALFDLYRSRKLCSPHGRTDAKERCVVRLDRLREPFRRGLEFHGARSNLARQQATQLGSCLRNPWDSQEGENPPTSSPDQANRTHCSENLSCGNFCRWTMSAKWLLAERDFVRRKSVQRIGNPCCQDLNSSSSPSIHTPGCREQRDHHQHGFSSGSDHAIVTDRPREHKPQREWYAFYRKMSELVL